jgi:hypothetical protein
VKGNGAHTYRLRRAVPTPVSFGPAKPKGTVVTLWCGDDKGTSITFIDERTLRSRVCQHLDIPEDTPFVLKKIVGPLRVPALNLKDGDNLVIEGVGLGGKKSKTSKTMEKAGQVVGNMIGKALGSEKLGEQIGSKAMREVAKKLGVGDKPSRKLMSSGPPLSMKQRKVTERFECYLEDITSGAAGTFLNNFWLFNPTTVNFLQRIPNYAKMYTTFCVKRLKLKAVPISTVFNTTAPMPTLYMTINPDASDTAYTTSLDMENSNRCKVLKCCDEGEYVVDCSKFAMNCYPVLDDDNGDLAANLLAPFSVQVGIQNPTGSGVADGSSLVKILISGEIEFSDPCDNDDTDVNSMFLRGLTVIEDDSYDVTFGDGQLIMSTGDFTDCYISTLLYANDTLNFPNWNVGTIYSINIGISMNSSIEDFAALPEFTVYNGAAVSAFVVGGTETIIDGNSGFIGAPSGASALYAAGATSCTSFMIQCTSNEEDNVPRITFSASAVAGDYGNANTNVWCSVYANQGTDMAAWLGGS